MASELGRVVGLVIPNTRRGCFFFRLRGLDFLLGACKRGKESLGRFCQRRGERLGAHAGPKKTVHKEEKESRERSKKQVCSIEEEEASLFRVLCLPRCFSFFISLPQHSLLERVALARLNLPPGFELVRLRRSSAGRRRRTTFPLIRGCVHMYTHPYLGTYIHVGLLVLFSRALCPNFSVLQMWSSSFVFSRVGLLFVSPYMGRVLGRVVFFQPRDSSREGERERKPEEVAGPQADAFLAFSVSFFRSSVFHQAGSRTRERDSVFLSVPLSVRARDTPSAFPRKHVSRESVGPAMALSAERRREMWVCLPCTYVRRFV